MLRKVLSIMLSMAIIFSIALSFGVPASAATVVPGEKIALLALSNNNYICAENSGTNPLIANKTTHGLSEEFIVVDAGEGLFALQATANNKYVSVQSNNQLIASATSIGANEKFQIIDAGGSNINIKANVNGKFVCADISATLPVTADRTAAGSWEVFQKVLVSSTQPSSVPFSRTGWTATASLNNGAAGNALDGNANTRWDTAALQANGQWYTVDMKENKTFNRITLDTTASSGDYPRGYQVFVSTDGTNFGSAIITGTGDGSITDIMFTSQTARYIKIVQTGTSGGYWSIHEYNVYNGTNPVPVRGLLGVTFGFSTETLHGGPYYNQGNQIYNLPLFKATSDETQFWDNYVEEIAYSGVDFVAPTIRGFITPDVIDSNGNYANAGGDTRLLSGLVSAINRRGLESKIKISCLDDTPASMTDKKNMAKYGIRGYTPLFDIADVNGMGEGGYKYWWDNNLRTFFSTVPDSMRLKIDGRPVVYEWGIGNFAFTNQGGGNLKKMIEYMRQRAQAEFGINPYLIVDKSWIDVDPTCSSVIDGVHTWFGVPGGFSNYTFNGKKFGCLVPEFKFAVGSTNMVIDPNHGQTLDSYLKSTVDSGANITLLEGFSDWEENAAVWRTKDLPYDQSHSDYPNQRINILRKHSANPFPTDLKVEAEGCDSYSDTTTGNAGGIFRDGNIDIQATTDTNLGWNVFNTAAGEWLQWQEIPMQGALTLKARIATNATGKRIRFVIDGTAGTTITLPNTGGLQTWETVNAGTFNFEQGNYHTVRIEFLDSGVNLNYWTN